MKEEKFSLKLTRRHNQGIFIGDDIEVDVIYIDEHCTRLKITAPKRYRILRKELQESKRNEV